jgi:hypothetical protein
MGAISFSIDIELVKFLKENLGLEAFVETGTFEGETLEKFQIFITIRHFSALKIRRMFL